MADLTVENFRAVLKQDLDVVVVSDKNKLAVLNQRKVKTREPNAETNMRTRTALYQALTRDSSAGNAYLKGLHDRLLGSAVANTPLSCREIKVVLAMRGEMTTSVNSFRQMVGRQFVAGGKTGLAGIVAQAAHASTAVISTAGLEELVKISNPNATDSYVKDLSALVNTVNGRLSVAYAIKGGDLLLDANKSCIGDAVNALSDLEDRLRKDVNAGKLKLTPGLSLLMDYCAARTSEIMTVYSEARSFAAKFADETKDKDLRDLVSAKAEVMHGNAAYVQELSADSQKVEELESKLQELKRLADEGQPDHVVSAKDIKDLQEQFVALRGKILETRQSAAEQSLSATILSRVARDINDLHGIQHIDFVKKVKDLVSTFIPSSSQALKDIRQDIVKAFFPNGSVNEKLLANCLNRLDGLVARDAFEPDACAIVSDRLNEIRDKINGSKQGGYGVSPKLLHRLLNGEAGFGSAVGAHVHGFQAESVDPTLDDLFLVSADPLGKGSANEVYKLVYKMPDGTEKTRVFKPELVARLSATHMGIGLSGYDKQNRMGEINISTHRCAEALGCPEIAVHVTVGMHSGQIGFFMDMAEGHSLADHNNRKKILPPFDGDTLKSLQPEQRIRRIGTLARESCKLEWQDWLTGQLDRHGENYLVGLDENGNSTVKGIDNDMAFMSYRIGLRRFVLDKTRLAIVKDKYGSLEKFKTVVGKDAITVKNAGAQGECMILDFDKVEPLKVPIVADRIFGIRSLARPNRIPVSVATYLQGLYRDNGEDYKKYKAVARELMKGHFSDDQISATAARLKEMTIYANKLIEKDPNAVMKEDDWLDADKLGKVLREQKKNATSKGFSPLDEYLYRDFFRKQFLEQDPATILK